jgi:hypothetical protein
VDGLTTFKPIAHARDRARNLGVSSRYLDSTTESLANEPRSGVDLEARLPREPQQHDNKRAHALSSQDDVG